jgi:pimeloyl-ACP methyl ester carboxylesterase
MYVSVTAMTRPTSLGTSRDVSLAHATVRIFESGPSDGPPVVFVHGVLANADLWQHVVPVLAGAGLRCIAVDWPLGSHELPVPDADLTPPGVADLVAELLVELDLHDVTIVGNDSGGAITQILMTRNPERIARVVLTPSDSFEKFFPPLFAALPVAARVPGAPKALTQALRARWVQRLPIGYGWLTKRPMPDDVVDSFLRPSRDRREIREDLTRFLRTVHRRHTLAAAEKLGGFDRPVLLAWATEDRVFPISLAERLAERLPDATIARIDDSLTFVPLDQPEVLADLIVDFVGRDAAA